MRFELLPGGILQAEGSIDVGAAERFAKEVAARGEYVKAVSLNSPGGSVYAGLGIYDTMQFISSDVATMLHAMSATIVITWLAFMARTARRPESDGSTDVKAHSPRNTKNRPMKNTYDSS